MRIGKQTREGVRIPGLGRLLHAYWRFSRGLTLGVRTVVIGEPGVFLVRHTYARGWHFPGGGVESGESALDAARRELREEARIEIVGEPSLHGVFFNANASRRDHVVVYVVRAFRVIEPKAPDREIAEARFFPLDALPPDLTRGTRARLEEIAGRAPVSARW
ncbi:MAG TPA: NUDIX domain-containing protein [Beijerinckiaceae bacterium]|jgi:ADP-ribose pyrophosphatase YjhB (NUDIX family)